MTEEVLRVKQAIAKLNQIIASAQELKQDYADRYEIAFGTPHKGVDPETHGYEGHRSVKPVSDPTGDAAVGQDLVIRSVRRMSNRIGQASAAIEEARTASSRAVHHAGHHERRGITKECWHCHEEIHRPKGRSSGLCDRCDAYKRKYGRLPPQHREVG